MAARIISPASSFNSNFPPLSRIFFSIPINPIERTTSHKFRNIMKGGDKSYDDDLPQLDLLCSTFDLLSLDDLRFICFW